VPYPCLAAWLRTHRVGQGKAFSAGGDLGFLEDRTRTAALDNVDIMKKFYARFLSVRTLPVPVIAAINGCVRACV
jgi:enoyl-CoA hydratase/carnithine racemase